MLLPKKCQNLTPDSDDTKRKGGNTHVYQSKVYVMNPFMCIVLEGPL